MRSVTQSHPILCHPMDCRVPGSFVHGILQARILEWVAISSSRGSSQCRDQTHISCISCTAGRFFEPTGKPMHKHYSLPAHNYSFHFQSSFLLFKSQTLPYLHHMLLMYVLLCLSRNVKILKKVTKKQYFHMTLLGKTLSLRSVFLPRTHEHFLGMTLGLVGWFFCFFFLRGNISHTICFQQEGGISQVRESISVGRAQLHPEYSDIPNYRSRMLISYTMF